MPVRDVRVLRSADRCDRRPDEPARVVPRIAGTEGASHINRRKSARLIVPW